MAEKCHCLNIFLRGCIFMTQHKNLVKMLFILCSVKWETFLIPATSLKLLFQCKIFTNSFHKSAKSRGYYIVVCEKLIYIVKTLKTLSIATSHQELHRMDKAITAFCHFWYHTLLQCGNATGFYPMWTLCTKGLITYSTTIQSFIT